MIGTKIAMLIASIITGLLGATLLVGLIFGLVFLDAPGSAKNAPIIIGAMIFVIIATPLWIWFSYKKNSLYIAYAPVVIFAAIALISSVKSSNKKTAVYSKLSTYSKDFICDGKQYNYI